MEPFIGSGAVLFWILRQFPNIRKAVINDINPDLARAYRVIKEEPGALIKALGTIERKYYHLSAEADRKDFFLEKRCLFNQKSSRAISRTALLIFLNRTCFNGLYRVNSQNQFNVPFGRYKKPRICDAENILACSRALQQVTILQGDYEQTLAYAGRRNSFFYFDPPYKPISRTSSFNAYAKNSFDDREQVRLKQFCDRLTGKGHQWLLSNSDPKNVNPEDHFFDELYCGDSLYMQRVKARRTINSKSVGRGEINEILVRNYPL